MGRRMWLSVLAAALFVLFLCIASPSRGQVVYGTIVGGVQDATGAAVPGAAVTITNMETNQARKVVTTGVGGYSLPNVLPGPYRLVVQATGFQAFTQEGVTVSINTVTRVDVQ